MTRPTYGSLFSGYGGLDLAVEAVLGAEAAWHCELDPNASKVLEAHWPGVPNLGDISAVDWSQVQPVDVLCGGFPCQDISSAGKGAGIKEGTRSGLWYRFADAIRVLRPRLVFVENVSALVVRGLDIIAADLAALGYGFTWDCVRASDVGACHRRERLFVVAWPAAGTPRTSDRNGAGPTRFGRPRSEDRRVAAADTDSQRCEEFPQLDGKPIQGSSHRPPRRRHADGCGDLAAEELALLPTPTTQPMSGNGHARHLGGELPAGTDWGKYAAAIHRWERLTRPAPAPREATGRMAAVFPEWMMGLDPGWVTDHLGRSAALKAIGNGVVPQQADHALTALLARIPAAQLEHAS